MTSVFRHPGVSDSIELCEDSGVTRRVPPWRERIPKVLGEASLIERIVAKYVWFANVKERKRRYPEDADARNGDR